MNGEIKKVTLADEPQSSALAIPADSPLGMLAAVAGGLDIDKLRALMDMQKEMLAMQAQQAFSKAFAAFKAEAITVIKGTTIKDGPLKGKRHANLYDVVVASAASLGKHGLSTAWKLTKDEPAWMEVTCVLRHEGGHSESVSMAAEPDKGPGRNSIQARGSAKTYLERYTLTAILGLAATEQDDDGRGAEEQRRNVGEYREPGQRHQRQEEEPPLLDDFAWREFFPDGWKTVRIAGGKPLAELKDNEIGLLWKKDALHPALCGWAADWCEYTINNIPDCSWDEVAESVPGTPPHIEDCNPANLWAVAAYLRKLKSSSEGAK